jgi:hypothetical protein
MGLLDADRGPEYLARMVDVAREYLAARVPGVRRSDTTSELLLAMQPHDGVEAELPRLLEQADLVKFAQEDLPRDEARAAGLEVRAIVDHVEGRLNPESERGKKSVARERAA